MASSSGGIGGFLSGITGNLGATAEKVGEFLDKHPVVRIGLIVAILAASMIALGVVLLQGGGLDIGKLGVISAGLMGCAIAVPLLLAEINKYCKNKLIQKLATIFFAAACSIALVLAGSYALQNIISANSGLVGAASAGQATSMMICGLLICGGVGLMGHALKSIMSKSQHDAISDERRDKRLEDLRKKKQAERSEEDPLLNESKEQETQL